MAATTRFQNVPGTPGWNVISTLDDDGTLRVTTVSKDQAVPQTTLTVTPAGDASYVRYPLESPESLVNVAALITAGAAGFPADFAARINRARRRADRADRQRLLEQYAGQQAEIAALIATDPNPPAG